MNMIKELLIVDGYNFLFNYKKNIKKSFNNHISFLRERFIGDLIDYRHYRNCDLIVVFDASKSSNISRNISKASGIEIIYSGKNESADSVIEELVLNKKGYENIFVITSDYTQQKVIFKKNIYRKSIREFAIELENVKKEIREKVGNIQISTSSSFYFMEKRLSKKIKEKLSAYRKKSTAKK